MKRIPDTDFGMTWSLSVPPVEKTHKCQENERTCRSQGGVRIDWL